MSIVSTPFLFLFLPAVTLVYCLISRGKGFQYRNHFLLIASLIFYLWAEHVFIVLLLVMVILTWCFGEMAYGRKGTRRGKTAVFLTVLINSLVLLLFSRLEFILAVLSRWFGTDLSYLYTTIPIGFSFFIFSSISYVVDIYRGQNECSHSFLHAALYTCTFFKILQGPIITYRKFEPQISTRESSFDNLSEGIYRFSFGLCKKIIIADNLSIIANGILSSDFSTLPLGDAWLGCITFMVYLCVDFSSYSDMAIGLARVFGFTIPENFNYPYISKSVSEFWNRWHITLYAWFTDYVYYPLLLGPSIGFRKYLLRKKFSAKTSKKLQSIFVLSVVWLISAIWHGSNINYIIWGMANCALILIDPHIRPFKNKRLHLAARHFGMFIFLALSMPLISIKSFGDSSLFYKAMFTGSALISDLGLYYLKTYWLFLVVGILGCFPVVPYFKKKFINMGKGGNTNQKIWDFGSVIILAALVFISISYLFTRDTVVFLYQQ